MRGPFLHRTGARGLSDDSVAKEAERGIDRMCKKQGETVGHFIAVSRRDKKGTVRMIGCTMQQGIVFVKAPCKESILHQRGSIGNSRRADRENRATHGDGIDRHASVADSGAGLGAGIGELNGGRQTVGSTCRECIDGQDQMRGEEVGGGTDKSGAFHTGLRGSTRSEDGNFAAVQLTEQIGFLGFQMGGGMNAVGSAGADGIDREGPVSETRDENLAALRRAPCQMRCGIAEKGGENIADFPQFALVCFPDGTKEQGGVVPGAE